MVVLALDQRGGLAHGLLFWGALVRQETLRVEPEVLPLSTPFTSPRRQEGARKIWVNLVSGLP